MYTVRRSGSVAEAIREARDIPTRVIPYAAAAALTGVAKLARDALREEMRRVFDRPTPYALNSLWIDPATKDRLMARVAIKGLTGGRGVRPESFMLPGVEGGGRRTKASEKALRYAGLLLPGEHVVPGDGAPLDAYGNIPGATMRMILRQVGVGEKAGRARRRRGASGRLQKYFVAAIGRRRQRGVWMREGRSIKPVLIFTRRAPTYRPRLDFAGTAERVALAEFPRLFRETADRILARYPGR